jgi:antirestriction protein ArdC
VEVAAIGAPRGAWIGGCAATEGPCDAGRISAAPWLADAGYAMEELGAEIGAAFLCADLVGITPETRDDHAAYIASWLQVLKNDKRAIFTAASHAQNAADYLHGLQPQTDTGDDMREAA